MALSGSYTYAVPGMQSQVVIAMSWTATQNVAANTSTVTAHASLQHKGSGAIYASGAKPWTISINGTKTSGSASISGGANSTNTLGSATATVPHNANGTKSFTLSFAINFGGVHWGATGANVSAVGCSNAFTLNTIPRESTFASISNITLGQTVSINIASHGNFTHNIQALIGSTSIGGWTGLAGGVNTITFDDTATAAIANALGTETSLQLSWIMSTNSGTTQIGGIAHGTSTVSLPASELAPSVGTFTVSEGNAGVAESVKTGSYIQGVSQLKFNVSGSSATHGATISSTSITFEGQTYANGATSAPIVNSGTLSAVATVTDSRGQSASKTVSVNVVAYSQPQILTAIAMRTNSAGGFQSDGQYCTVSYSVLASDLPFTDGANTVKLSIDSQVAGAANWTQVKTISSTTFKAEGTVTLGSGYEGTQQYNIRLSVKDSAGGTNQVVITLDAAHVLMSWNKTQVGIGKVAQNGTLDVLGDQYLEGNMNVTGNTNLTGDLNITGNASAKTLTVGGVSVDPTIQSQLANSGKLVWSGALYPQAADSCHPSIPLSQTKLGWIIRWTYYLNGKPQNTNYCYTLIPNLPIPSTNTLVMTLSMPLVGTFFKQVYYVDDTIAGVAGNNQGTQAPKAVMNAVYAV